MLACRTTQPLILARKAERQEEKGKQGVLEWEVERGS
jgi:hypothetical protein